jgi:hypothetical protein
VYSPLPLHRFCGVSLPLATNLIISLTPFFSLLEIQSIDWTPPTFTFFIVVSVTLVLLSPFTGFCLFFKASHWAIASHLPCFCCKHLATEYYLFELPFFFCPAIFVVYLFDFTILIDFSK